MDDSDSNDPRRLARNAYALLCFVRARPGPILPSSRTGLFGLVNATGATGMDTALDPRRSRFRCVLRDEGSSGTRRAWGGGSRILRRGGSGHPRSESSSSLTNHAGRSTPLALQIGDAVRSSAHHTGWGSLRPHSNRSLPRTLPSYSPVGLDNLHKALLRIAIRPPLERGCDGPSVLVVVLGRHRLEIGGQVRGTNHLPGGVSRGPAANPRR